MAHIIWEFTRALRKLGKSDFVPLWAIHYSLYIIAYKL